MPTSSGAACIDGPQLIDGTGASGHALRWQLDTDIEAVIDLTTGVQTAATSCSSCTPWSPLRTTQMPPELPRPSFGSWLGASAWNPLLSNSSQGEQPLMGCDAAGQTFLLTFELTSGQARCGELQLEVLARGDLVEIALNDEPLELVAPPATPPPPLSPYAPAELRRPSSPTPAAPAPSFPRPPRAPPHPPSVPWWLQPFEPPTPPPVPAMPPAPSMPPQPPSPQRPCTHVTVDTSQMVPSGGPPAEPAGELR